MPQEHTDITDYQRAVAYFFNYPNGNTKPLELYLLENPNCLQRHNIRNAISEQIKKYALARLKEYEEDYNF